MNRWIFLMIVFVARLNAQDTIFFRNQEVRAVKVSEIGVSEIKYHNFDNLEGPLYIAAKSDIRSIKYPNGKVDTFQLAPVKTDGNLATSKPPAYPVQRIEIKRRNLKYDGEKLKEPKMLKLILEYPFPDTKNLMKREYAKLNGYRNSRFFGFGLLTVGILTQLTGFGSNSGALILAGGAIGISGCVVTNVYKHKIAQKKVDVAKIYNEWK